MKSCLIIASPRSGSTNLMRSIARGNKLKECFEPFGSKTSRKLRIENHCTKVIARRKPVEYWIELTSLTNLYFYLVKILQHQEHLLPNLPFQTLIIQI